MNDLQQLKFESAKSKAASGPRTISLSPFDTRPAPFDDSLLFDFAPELTTATRPASLFTAECHVSRNMFAKGARA
jgi:hypothetical protein